MNSTCGLTFIFWSIDEKSDSNVRTEVDDKGREGGTLVVNADRLMAYCAVGCSSILRRDLQNKNLTKNHSRWRECLSCNNRITIYLSDFDACHGHKRLIDQVDPLSAQTTTIKIPIHSYTSSSS
jgi:hypothetical protein